MAIKMNKAWAPVLGLLAMVLILWLADACIVASRTAARYMSDDGRYVAVLKYREGYLNYHYYVDLIDTKDSRSRRLLPIGRYDGIDVEWSGPRTLSLTATNKYPDEPPNIPSELWGITINVKLR